MHDFTALIEECRRRLGREPRRFWFWNRSYLTAQPPAWMKDHPQDPLWGIFKLQSRLLKEGRVVWGHIVQANTLLFEPGPHDCPASVLLSHDPRADGCPDKLQQTSQAIFRLKGTTPADPILAEFARVITDEMERHWQHVPTQVSGLSETYNVALMFFRKHLPIGYLPPVGLPYPVLTIPGEKSALIVPGRYWPEALLSAHRQAVQ